MNSERIEKAIALLGNLPPNAQFEMSRGSPPGGFTLNLSEHEYSQLIIEGDPALLRFATGGYCGDALGWLPMIRLFRDDGFSPCVDYDPEREIGFVVPVFEDDGRQYFGIEAAARYFEVSRGVANWLFDPYLYPLRHIPLEQVIERLTQVVDSDAVRMVL